MRDVINKIHYQELAEQNPDEVCKRALCKYDMENRCYTLSVWGDEYVIFPRECRIDRIADNDPDPHEYFYLFIIQYLLKSKEIEPNRQWISEKDIPGGVAFFRGPHEIPCHLITERYSNDIIAFKNQCRQLNGIPLEMADAAFSFDITSRIPAAVLYWKGDNEFPPESKILYDKTICEHLTCDILFALAVAICTRIGSDITYGG
jgi:hypothetical protein